MDSFFLSPSEVWRRRARPERKKSIISHASNWLLVLKTVHCVITMLTQCCPLYMTLFRALLKFIGRPNKARYKWQFTSQSSLFGFVTERVKNVAWHRLTLRCIIVLLTLEKPILKDKCGCSVFFHGVLFMKDAKSIRIKYARVKKIMGTDRNRCVTLKSPTRAVQVFT